MNFDNYLFRASQVGLIMTDARSKSEPLSETTKSNLLEIYVSECFNRKKDITSKYLEKGLTVEDDAITLFSIVNNNFHIKNEERFKNEFICGTPDIVDVEENTIIDIKSSYDIFSFAKSRKEENKIYYWQLQSYMDLTGLKKATLAYCLVDTPQLIIEREIKKALYQSGLSEDSASFLKYKVEMESYHKYEDIPKSKRVFVKNYNYDSEAILKMQERIIECRNYLNNINW